MCTDQQVSCHGACFDRVGQKQNGCELVAARDRKLKTIDLVDGTLYAVVDKWPAPELVRISAQTFVSELVWTMPDYALPYRVPLIDGFVDYSHDATEQAGTLTGLFRVPITGGQPQFVTPLRGAGEFLVAGGFAYEYGDDLFPPRRTAVTGGATQEIGSLTDEDSLAVDATHYYVHRADQGSFERISKADPSKVERIPWDRRFSGRVLLWPQDPAHVYFLDGAYNRADKSSLSAETLSMPNVITYAGKQASDHYFISEFYTSGAGQDISRFIGIRWDGQVDTIDNTAFGDVTEDAQYYYLVRDGALLRIAR
jgi:hypothetical protein